MTSEKTCSRQVNIP